MMEDSKVHESTGPTVIIRQDIPRSNGVGVAGFVLALIALFLGWVPIWGWLLWILGLILSFCGIFKAPRGLAIAGLVISVVGFFGWLLLFGAIVAVFATL